MKVNFTKKEKNKDPENNVSMVEADPEQCDYKDRHSLVENKRKGKYYQKKGAGYRKFSKKQDIELEDEDSEKEDQFTCADEQIELQL